jgi:membrane associated rhomboid family serine protease
MAQQSSPNSSSLSGFHNAPVSKTLLILSVASTFLCEAIPRLAPFIFLTSRDDLITKGQVWRLLTSLLPCDSLPAGLATWLLLYWFRFFERQLGSSKFAAYVTFSVFLAIVSRLSLAALPRNVIVGVSGFSAGPAFIALGLVPLYALKVPTLIPEYFRLCGLRFSDKSLTYLLVAQLVFSDGSRSILPASVSLLGGILYANDVLGLQSRLRFPVVVRNFCKRHILPLIESNGSESLFLGGGMAGSGPSAQRGTDNDAALAAMGRINGGGGGGGRPMGNLTQRRPGSFPETMQNFGGGGGGGGVPLGPEPNPEAVERICAMGFGREQAIAALRRSFGDEAAAVNFILAED